MIVDLSFEEKMTDSELKSLCQQLAYCHSANTRSSKPMHLIFTGVQVRALEMGKLGFWRVACDVLTAGLFEPGHGPQLPVALRSLTGHSAGPDEGVHHQAVLWL